MSQGSPQASEFRSPVIPAPYGTACAGCSRAKCKCFFLPEGSQCERCHRLGKPCEPAGAGEGAGRKRKRQRKTLIQPSSPAPASKLEEKLEDLVSLLRSQAVAKQSNSTENDSPSTLSEAVSYVETISATSVRDPDLVIDTTTSVVHLLRPTNSDEAEAPWLIHNDVAVHKISDRVAEEGLNMLRESFISMFPFVHIPASMSAARLRHESPFLWLVIMALTTKLVSQQFEMEETIWRIISGRIVAEHLADLDLLLGVICFASWSHYFKKDKPFMTMLSQLVVSLAFELGLHKDAPSTMTQHNMPSQFGTKLPPKPQLRTMEERRTILALFHLTSSTWTAYRKTEPLRWTPYMDKCLSILSEGKETPLDIILATQVKCQLITNQLTYNPLDESVSQESSSQLPVVLRTALLGQLNAIRQSLPSQIHSDRAVQLYLHSTELVIKKSFFGRLQARDQTSLSHLHRLQDLDSMLTSAERWITLFHEMPLTLWAGINVDTFAQFTHCLVVLFRLTTLDEPGWDLNEVRKRADVLEILDRSCEIIDRVPGALGIVDAVGPRRGLFFKTNYLLRAIKALFLSGMSTSIPGDTSRSSNLGGGDNSSSDLSTASPLDDGFLMDLSDEPWFSEMMLGPTWDSGADNLFNLPFTT